MRLLIVLFGLIPTLLFSQKISYEVSMPKPQNHYFHVEMVLTGFNANQLTVKMPVWAPGSYLVREFSKNVDLVKAFDELGKPLKVSKRTKNAWSVEKGSASTVKVVYDVYSFELSVRTSFLDLTHGFISGSGVFMYLDGQKQLPGELTVKPYKDFKKVSTSLTPADESVASDGTVKFKFNDYDQLVDCPIEVGNQEVFHFMAAGVDHTVAIYGEGNYDVKALKKDMAHIVETATSVIGENPNKNYTFIIHNVVDGQGGLEHTNSCTLSVNRWTYQGGEYIGFLSLVAHEYFHLWNVKRIRPIELGPFNYDEENYTSLLWVMEGFTSYYDELLLVRAGFTDPSEYIQKIQSTINYVEGSVGARVQPVAHASFDAWIKAYRPTENSSNTTMTYYSRGQMLAAILDVMIISKYKGQKCLDHFLQVLYNKYYKGLNRGFSEQEFQDELEAFLGEDMDEFFRKYVFGTEIAPLQETFKKVGLQVEETGVARPSFGASLRQEGGKVLVRGIRSGSAAEQAGISVNDEIIGCNGYRIDQSALEQFTGGLKSGEKFDLLISREEKLMNVSVTMTDYLKPQFIFKKTTDTQGEKLRNYWLRTKI
ncbi:MAG: PDZ domain-containing protein [Cryomorphaceae bacterium]|nr:PDZ domain-containing protein [Cryomorphaceae bacterium]